MKGWVVFLLIVVVVVWLFKDPFIMLIRSTKGPKTRPSDLRDSDNSL